MIWLRLSYLSGRADNMAETKKRQGQIKPDGTKAVAKSVCPDCGAYLQNAYITKKVNNKRDLIIIGLACPDCDYWKRNPKEDKE